MPTSKRGKIKKKHVAIANALTKALDWDMELHGMYLEHHPNRADAYLNIGMLIKQALIFIEKMHSHV